MAECEHKWVYIDSSFLSDSTGGYNIHYVRIDRFFCEKCLEQKETRKEEYAREKPEWFNWPKVK